MGEQQNIVRRWQHRGVLIGLLAIGGLFGAGAGDMQAQSADPSPTAAIPIPTDTGEAISTTVPRRATAPAQSPSVDVLQQEPTASASPTASPAPLPCGAEPLGLAVDYTLFVLGELEQQGTESRGRVAASGDARLQNYGVGLGLTPPERPDAVLVVGGNLSYTSGAVAGGDVVYGGTAVVEKVEIRNGRLYQGAPIDFAANRAYLQQVSRAWGALTANGTVGGAPTLRLQGASPTLNVFTLAATDLTAASELIITAPAGSTVLVNLTGAAPELSNMRLTLEGPGPSDVLFNAFEALQLRLDGVDIQGSLLAPFARVAFNNGGMNGTLIGASLAGSGETRVARFRGCLPTAGEAPAPLATATAGPTEVAPQPVETPAPTAEPPPEAEESEDDVGGDQAAITPTSLAPAPQPTAVSAGGVQATAVVEEQIIPAQLPNTSMPPLARGWIVLTALALALGGALLWNRSRS